MDEATVASAIETVVEEQDLAIDLGERGRARYLDLFRRVLCGNGRVGLSARSARPSARWQPSARAVMKKLRIAFISHRYGPEVNGGAESYCRMFAERMAHYHQVEVLTTRALDYVTWRNEYPKAQVPSTASPCGGSQPSGFGTAGDSIVCLNERFARPTTRAMSGVGSGSGGHMPRLTAIP